jgi:hypothetical protein
MQVFDALSWQGHGLMAVSTCARSDDGMISIDLQVIKCACQALADIEYCVCDHVCEASNQPASFRRLPKKSDFWGK